MLRILEGVGISKVEAEVYVYLARWGPTRSIDLAVNIGKTQPQINSILRRLNKKGVVKYSKCRSRLFSALDFGEVIERYVKLNMEQAKVIEEVKEQLLSSLGSATHQHDVGKSEKQSS